MTVWKVTLIFVTVFWMGFADPTTLQEIEIIQTKCQEEHGITEEMFVEMRKREMILEDENDETRKCFIDCMLVGLGIIKEGQVDVTTVMHIAKPMLDSVEAQGREVDEENLKTDIKNCSLEGQKEKCTDNYETWKCLHDVLSRIMVPTPRPEE